MTPRVFAGLFAAVLALAACASTGETTSAPSSPTVPAAKETCAELVPSPGQQGLELVDRELIPYSRVLLSVTTEYRGPGSKLTLLSGGTLDDAIEAYDNLGADDPIELSVGLTAQVLSGTFFGDKVMVATWRTSKLDPGCRQRAAVAVGMESEEFRSTVEELGVRAGDGE